MESISPFNLLLCNATRKLNTSVRSLNQDANNEILQKVLNFGRSFDEGTPEAREQVWLRFSSLLAYQIPGASSSNNFFGPMLCQWLQQPKITLFTLELLFVAFLASTSITTDPNSNVSQNNGDQPPSTFSPWGYTLPSTLCQLVLLEHWESKLEKLSTLHKKVLWSTCKQVPQFSNYEETSISQTLKVWSLQPFQNSTNINIFFSSLGYLKEAGILKTEFCFPKTTISVFARNSNSSPPLYSPTLVSPINSPSLRQKEKSKDSFCTSPFSFVGKAPNKSSSFMETNIIHFANQSSDSASNNFASDFNKNSILGNPCRNEIQLKTENASSPLIDKITFFLLEQQAAQSILALTKLVHEEKSYSTEDPVSRKRKQSPCSDTVRNENIKRTRAQMSVNRLLC